MQIALIGLGKMGANMARRWARGGVKVLAFDRSAEARAATAEANITAVESLAAALQAVQQFTESSTIRPTGSDS